MPTQGTGFDGFGLEIINPMLPPTQAGYSFQGYYSDTNGNGTQYYTDIMASARTWNIAEDTTLYAYFLANQYTVLFNSNGGNTADPTSKSVTYDSAYGALATVTRDYYDFNGWYTASSGGALRTAASIYTIVGNQTLFAQWTPISYSITYNLNGGTNSGSNPTSYTYESAAITFANPTRTGHTFAGWYSDVGLTVSKTGIPAGSNGNVVVYADWTIESYTLNFIENGGTPVNNITGNFGDLIAPPSNPTRTGYTFGGWFDNSGLLGDQFVFPTTFPDYGVNGTVVSIYAK
jgi:uncharacterized repeat protein (TIGR02543 family)